MLPIRGETEVGGVDKGVGASDVMVEAMVVENALDRSRRNVLRNEPSDC